MKLTVLISTLNDGIKRVSQIFLAPDPTVDYTVVHQVTDPQFEVSGNYFRREDVTLITSFTKGLSKSRNIGIQHAKGDIAIFADDDVRYKEGYFRQIFSVYENDDSLDVACFKIATQPGEPEYKRYHSQSHLVVKPLRHFISSVEITVRLRAIRKAQIQFDERFGLGSGLVLAGEEGVFIDDCLKNGLKVFYFPAYVVEHPFESTIKQIDRLSKERIIMMGAADARKNGPVALLNAFMSTYFKFSHLRQNKKNPVEYLYYTLKGNLFILLKRKHL